MYYVLIQRVDKFQKRVSRLKKKRLNFRKVNINEIVQEPEWRKYQRLKSPSQCVPQRYTGKEYL